MSGNRFFPWAALTAWLAALIMALAAAAGAAGAEDAPTYMDMGKTTSLDEIMAILDANPQLTRVDMFERPMWAKGIALLSERYPQIEFGWTIRFGDHIVRTDATAFSTLHHSGARTHGDGELSLLKYCKKLKALDIGHNGGRDLSFVSGMTELRVLIIACNRFTDLSPLANLHKLEYLELFSNHVTDLSPLSGLTHLMDLNICYNDITDLSPLYGMKNLKRLWLYNCNNYNQRDRVPAAEVEKLRAALPDTEVDASHMPTAGTWREHPHFAVIRAMFRSPDGYRPFEDSWPEEDELR